jgi:hypothetical protein
MPLKGWTVTMGVGPATTDGVRVEDKELESKADALMYAIKESSRGGLAHEASSAPESDYIRSFP